MQTRELKEYIERRGWRLVGEFVDIGISGTKETFKALGIDFVSFSEQMDTSTPAGKMVFTVLGAVAELERSLIVERVKAGMRNARAKGRRIGRPPQNPLSSELRTIIANAYGCGGTSLRAVAKKFGTSLATVQRCVGEHPQ